MSIDLDSTEGRKQYLSEKLDDLLKGINDSYGTILMEELLSRLELTVKDFNEEMKNIYDELVSKEKERQQLLEMLKTTEGLAGSIQGQNISPVVSDKLSDSSVAVADDKYDEDVPEWEKKLAKLEKIK